jgi:hypothetical protein
MRESVLQELNSTTSGNSHNFQDSFFWLSCLIVACLLYAPLVVTYVMVFDVEWLDDMNCDQFSSNKISIYSHRHDFDWETKNIVNGCTSRLLICFSFSTAHLSCCGCEKGIVSNEKCRRKMLLRETNQICRTLVGPCYVIPFYLSTYGSLETAKFYADAVANISKSDKQSSTFSYLSISHTISC